MGIVGGWRRVSRLHSLVAGGEVLLSALAVLGQRLFVRPGVRARAGLQFDRAKSVSAIWKERRVPETGEGTEGAVSAPCLAELFLLTNKSCNLHVEIIELRMVVSWRGQFYLSCWPRPHFWVVFK